MHTKCCNYTIDIDLLVLFKGYVCIFRDTEITFTFSSWYWCVSSRFRSKRDTTWLHPWIFLFNPFFISLLFFFLCWVFYCKPLTMLSRISFFSFHFILNYLKFCTLMHKVCIIIWTQILSQHELRKFKQIEDKIIWENCYFINNLYTICFCQEY